jgi:plasmid stabilization system protein ParE
LNRRVIVRPEARDELDEAAAWYRQKSPAVAESFKVAVRQTLRGISEWPAASPRISDRVRRALTKQFPYAIFYSDDSEEIVILAIRHQAQDPKSWPNGY